MCALCGVLNDGPHWTEAGTDAGQRADVVKGRERYLEQVYRVKLINLVLAAYGCTAEAWAGGQYIVRNKSGGGSMVVQNLPMIWQAVEDLTKRVADPLADDLVGSLDQAAPVSH